LISIIRIHKLALLANFHDFIFEARNVIIDYTEFDLNTLAVEICQLAIIFIDKLESTSGVKKVNCLKFHFEAEQGLRQIFWLSSLLNPHL
jgi:hypothetical protein